MFIGECGIDFYGDGNGLQPIKGGTIDLGEHGKGLWYWKVGTGGRMDCL